MKPNRQGQPAQPTGPMLKEINDQAIRDRDAIVKMLIDRGVIQQGAAVTVLSNEGLQNLCSACYRAGMVDAGFGSVMANQGASPPPDRFSLLETFDSTRRKIINGLRDMKGGTA